MKVKEIIKFTEWIPNPHKLAETPKFSILMPTYRRFASGHLTRAIQSVLDQTYKDFELILIDDGSVDGSFDEIQRFMKLDPRIHCLHHPRNVGLPAIGCYEAYIKSRAEYLMFCFDDTEYQKSALEHVARYVSTHNPKLAFGYIDYHYRDKHGDLLQAYLGRDRTSQAYLQMTNFLPNLGAIMHRNVPNEIGFLDPHPAVARMTDWDYWKRAAKVYELHYSDIHIGTEFGLITTNSLGLTYPLNPWMAYEWTEQDRNSALLPGNYEEYDVQAIPDDMSDQSKLVLLDAFRFYSDKFWCLPQPPFTISPSALTDSLNRNTKILVLTRSPDASVTLTFGHIPDASKMIRFVLPIQFDSHEMINASAIIISRHLFSPEMYHWVKMARQLGVPHYYYIDDNLIILSKEIAELSKYTAENLRKELASFSGVLVSSQALANFFTENNIHTTIYTFPPIMPPKTWMDDSQFPEKPAGTIRIGFMGGPHRHREFMSSVLPAIRRLAKERAVELVIGGNLKIFPDKYPELKIYQFPFDISYRLSLGRMQSAHIDVLAHAGSVTQNNPYKTHNVLLSACALQAFPILANQPPYEDVEKLGLGLLCSNTDEWHRNLQRAVSELELVSQVKANLQRYATENFTGSQNLEVLRSISQKCPSPGAAIIDNRYRHYIDVLKRTKPTSPDWDPETSPAGSWLEAIMRRNRAWLLPANSPQERLSRFIFRNFFSAHKGGAISLAPQNRLMAQGAVRLVNTLEYRLRPTALQWNGFEFMIGTHQRQITGQIAIEIVDLATRSTVRQTTLDLTGIRDNEIVPVDFEKIDDSKDKEFLVRFLLVKAGPESSVSIYEENQMESRLYRMLRRLGLLTRGNTLACRLEYADQ